MSMRNECVLQIGICGDFYHEKNIFDNLWNCLIHADHGVLVDEQL